MRAPFSAFLEASMIASPLGLAAIPHTTELPTVRARELTWVMKLVAASNGWRREGHPRSPRRRLLRDPVLGTRDRSLGAEDERGDPATGPVSPSINVEPK